LGSVAKLARDIICDAGRTSDELNVAVSSWGKLAGKNFVSKILALAEATCGLSGDECMKIAASLRGMGNSEAAIELWCKVCIDESLVLGLRWQALEELLAVDGGDRASRALREALASCVDATERRRLRQLIGWVEPLTPMPSA
jgi:hypothetical protein